MNSVHRNKILNVMEEGNGSQALDVFNMVVYFAQGEIPIGIFSRAVQNRNELKDAIRTLHRHSLVQYSGGSSFTISQGIQFQHRGELFEVGVEERILKKSISLLKTNMVSYYPHLVSVYSFCKYYPNLLRNLHDIPGNIVSGMVKDGRVAEAVTFGTECRAFYMDYLGEGDWTVLHLRCNLGLALFESGKTEEAITMLTNAYTQTCSTFENDEGKIREVMTALATVTIGGNHILKQKNEKSLRLVVCNAETASDCKSNTDLNRWSQYALMISNFGLKSEAIAILHDVIECRSKIFGDIDVGIGDAIQSEAVILASDSKYTEAMDLLQIVLKGRKKGYGDFNPKTLEVMIEIGKVLIKQGKLEESLTLFKEVKNKVDVVVDKHDRLVLMVMTEMVKIYKLKREFRTSYDDSLEVYDKLVTAFGNIHPWCFSFRRDMGEILVELHRPEDAIRIWEELLETYENSPAYEQDLMELRSKIQSVKVARFDAKTWTLHYLAKEGDWKGVLAKIKLGSDTEEKDLTGMTPLHYASAFGRLQVARGLLIRGACYASPSNCGSLPHDVAEDAAMRRLLQAASDVFAAVRSGDIDAVVSSTAIELCVASARDAGGRTPLGIAVEMHFAGIAIVLLEHGANPAAPHLNGNPLHVTGSAEMARILLRKLGTRRAASALAVRDSNGLTPLHIAAMKGCPRLARTLLANGAAFDAAGSGVTPLDMARGNPCEPLLKLIQDLFLQTRKGSVVAASRRLDGLAEEDVSPVLGARNDKQLSLMNLAVRFKRLVLVKKLVKLKNVSPGF